MLTRTAHLRVYLAGAEDGLPNTNTVSPELNVGELGIVGEAPDAADLVTEWSGRPFVCPNNVRLRMLEGVLAFYNAYAAGGDSPIVPESVARRAAKELERLYSGGPRSRSHILTSAWFVPLRWFVPFKPPEREVLGSDEITGIRYRAALADASGRLERALAAMAEVRLDESVVQQVEELAEWINAFEPGSMVELDYGTVAGLFSPADLVLDETAADVWASIEALERSDLTEAGEHYAAAASRWAGAMAVTYSN